VIARPAAPSEGQNRREKLLGEEGSGRSVEGRKPPVKCDGESDQIRGEMNGREAVASGIADSVAVVPFKLPYLSYLLQ
jgi:hypothetical protein